MPYRLDPDIRGHPKPQELAILKALLDRWHDKHMGPRGVFRLQIGQEIRDSRVEGVERVGWRKFVQ
jgi:hypothetical protein